MLIFICHDPYNALYDFDIRPLVKELLLHANDLARFSFIYRKIDPLTGSWMAAVGPNKMLAALHPSLSPHPKAYMPSAYNLDAALMRIDGAEITFRLRNGSYRQDLMATTRYVLSTNGELDLIQGNYTPSLMGIRWTTPIRAQLLKRLAFPTKIITYDLSRKKISPALSAIFHTNHALRALTCETLSSGSYWRRIREVIFRVEMSTQSLRATFDQFVALASWATTGRPLDRGGFYGLNTDVPRGPWKRSPAITLDSEVSGCVGLDDLRVEVTDLVFRTFPLRHTTSICIRMLKHAADDAPATRAFSTLYRLRRALLVFLADQSLSHPGLQFGLCPRVWAGGELRLREAEFDTQTIVNDKYRYTPARLNKARSYQMQRFAPGKVDRYWGCYQSLGNAPHLASGTYETLLSCTTFLARFLQRYQHPQVDHKENTRHSLSRWSDDCLPWKELHPIRPILSDPSS